MPTSGSWVSSRTILMAASTSSALAEAMETVPSSSMLMTVLVRLVMSRMTLPPGPMMSLMRSGLILTETIRGAHRLISVRGLGSTSSILPRMWSRPSRAWSRAWDMISWVSPGHLMSIWMAVMPFSVPQTLKSMSPRWSSSPRMSERTT